MQNYFPSPYGAPPVFGGAPVTWYSGASLPPESGLGKRDGPEHAQDRAACDILQASKRPCLDAHSNTMPHDVLRPPECLVPDALQKRGYLGVRWSHKKNKWRVRIKANGKVHPFLSVLPAMFLSHTLARASIVCVVPLAFRTALTIGCLETSLPPHRTTTWDSTPTRRLPLWPMTRQYNASIRTGQTTLRSNSTFHHTRPKLGLLLLG